jgi:hypothetical protein
MQYMYSDSNQSYTITEVHGDAMDQFDIGNPVMTTFSHNI